MRARIIPMSVNEFVEDQLSQRAHELENVTESHVLAINGEIIFGVDDVIRNVIEERVPSLGGHNERKRLTVVVTTPGGYIEIVQRIVGILRYHYENVDFIVPSHAFSAGTVLVMSGDSIWMDYFSRLGPIDPQVETGDGRLVPALGYLIQWERLLEKANNKSITMAEIQLMIQGFDQAELYKYEQARELSISLLKQWLVKYKFKNWLKTQTRGLDVINEMREKRASEIATQLNNTDRWHSHGHGISMEILINELNLIIDDFGRKEDLRKHIRNYHALLEDYMAKMGHRGAVHTVGIYKPYA